MPGPARVPSVLARAALIAAGCWPVVAIQFVAESVFKLLVAVPIVGGALLSAILLGRSAGDLTGGDLSDTVTTVIEVLLAHPTALVAFVGALLVVVVGGSGLMFLLKGGTVTILLEAESAAPWLASRAVPGGSGVYAVFRGGSRFSVDRFAAGARRLARRYLKLGLVLMTVYGIIAALYLAVVLGGYRYAGNRALFLGWAMVVAVCSGVLVVAITVVNLLYLLVQIAIALTDRGIRAAFADVLGFLRADIRDVAGVFLVILGVVLILTIASISATAALGFVSVVPIAGLVALPLQLVGWVLRSLLTQYTGLVALTAYATLLRRRGDLTAAGAP